MIFCLTLRKPFYLLDSYWFFCEKFREMGGAGCIAFRGWLKLLITPFVVDERLTFCLGLTRIARNFLVFVGALYTLGTSFISAMNQLNEVYQRTDVPVGLYSYF